MSDREILQLILAETQDMNKRISNIETDVSGLKTDMTEVKEDIAELKTDVSELKTEMAEVKEDIAELKADMTEVKADIVELKTDMSDMKIVTERLSQTVEKHFSMTLEFYGRQMEHNTRINDLFEIMIGQMDMHTNQISRNTADIKKLKLIAS